MKISAHQSKFYTLFIPGAIMEHMVSCHYIPEMGMRHSETDVVWG